MFFQKHLLKLQSEQNLCSNYYGDQINCPCDDQNTCGSSCGGEYTKITANSARQGKHCSMKLLFYKNDECAASNCPYKYKISRQISTSMSLANYKRSFRINECIEMKTAREILKSDFFKMKNLETHNENAIEICCPPYAIWKEYFDQDKIFEANSSKLAEDFKNEYEKCINEEHKLFGNEEIEKYFELSVVPLGIDLIFMVSILRVSIYFLVKTYPPSVSQIFRTADFR